MTASIGTFSFLIMNGDLDPPGPEVEAIQRPGINGTAWRFLGSKGLPFQVETMAFITNSVNAGIQINNYRQSVGTDLTMIDPIGNTYYIYVEAVKSKQPKCVNSSNMGPGYLIESQWTLRMIGG